MQRKCNEKNDWPNGFYRLRWSSSMPMYGSLCRGLFRTSKNPYACFSRSGSYDKKTHWPKLGREGCANEDVSRASCHQCLWTVRPKSFIKWRQCFTPLVSCLSTLSAIAWENRWRRFASSRFFSATANSHLQYTRWNSVDVYVYVYIYIYLYIYIYTYIYISWKVLGCPDGCLLFKSQSTSKLVSPTSSMAHSHWRLRPSGTSPGAHGVLRVG